MGVPSAALKKAIKMQNLAHLNSIFFGSMYVWTLAAGDLQVVRLMLLEPVLYRV